MAYLRQFLIQREVQTISVQADVPMESLLSLEWHRTEDHNGYRAYKVSIAQKNILIWIDEGGLAGILVSPAQIVDAS